MLPKTEWKWLVRYWRLAQEDLQGLVVFPQGHHVSEAEAEARKRLLKRGLLETRRPGHADTGVLDQLNVPYLAFTLPGEDEARVYSSWFWRSGRWYCDHLRHHWLWNVLSFLAGVLGAVMAHWLSKTCGLGS